VTTCRVHSEMCRTKKRLEENPLIRIIHYLIVPILQSQLNISSINNYTCGKFAGCEDGGEDRKSTSSSDEKNDIGAKNSEDESGGGDDGIIFVISLI